MRTDRILVNSRGRRMESALREVEKVAAYKELSPKGALHLRLLTEEMMGMMRSITGEKEGQFWIEDEDGVYQLHLVVRTDMDDTKREQLLAASTSGKNEAAKGLMGRLRDFFDLGTESASYPLYQHDMMEFSSSTALDWEWKMTAYQNELRQWAATDEKAREMWDELEKSVVTHVADEIKVAVRGPRAEMTIVKKMD